MQKTLPANFNQWDDAPPKTLPANFDQWDAAPAPKPKTIEEEAAAAGGLPVAAPSAPKVQMKEEYVPGLAKPYLVGVDAAAAANKALVEKQDDSTVAKVSKAVGRSAMKTGRALTEPKNLAIMGGLAAVNAAQLIPGSQPITIPLAQAANATAATYFGAEMASALPQQYGEYSKAVDRGDVGGAVESLTDMGTGAAMSATGLRHGVGSVKPQMEARMGVAKPAVPVSKAAIENHQKLTEIEKRDEAALGVRPIPEPVRAPGASPAMVSKRAAELAAQDIFGKPVASLTRPEVERVLAAVNDKSVEKGYLKQAQEQLAAEMPTTVPRDLPVPLDGPPPTPPAPPQATPFTLPTKTAAPPPRPRADVEAQLGPLGAVVPSRALGQTAARSTAPPVTPTGLTAEIRQRGEIGSAAATVPSRVMGETPYQQHLKKTMGDAYANILPTRITEAQVEAPAPLTPPTPPPTRTTRRRGKGQAGSLLLPEFLSGKKSAAPPQTLGEKFALEEAAKREAAKAEDSSFLATIKSWRDNYRKGINDTTVPLTDALKPLDSLAGKTEVKPTTGMNDLIDKALRAPTIASRMLMDAKIPQYAWDVKNLNYLDQLMIAKRALEIEGAGFKTGRDAGRDRQIVTDLENMEAIPAGKDRPAMTYGQVAKEYTRFQNSILDATAESGLISKDLAAYLKDKYESYIPIERWQEAYDHAHRNARGASQVASIARQTVVQKLTGSDRIIDSSILSSIHRADKALGQITRNNAARYLTEQLKRLDPGDGSVIRPKADGEHIPSDRLVTRFVDGMKQDFVVDPAISAAAKSLDVKQLGWAMQNIVAPATRLLKLGTTGVNLRFAAVNFARDLMATAVTMSGKAGIAAVADPRILWKAGKAIMPKSKTMREMELGGGGFTSYDISRGQAMPEIEMMRMWKHPGEYAKNVGAAIKDFPRNPKQSLSKIAAPPIRSLGALLRATENTFGKTEQFGRARIYEATKRQRAAEGFTAEDAGIEAIHESNNALPNYVRSGSITRVLNPVIPYLTANVRGVISLTRALERSPIETVGKIMTFATAAAAVAAWNLSDPKRREIYLDLAPYDRRDNLNIIGPNTRKNAQGRYENLIKIPLPQGINSLTDVARKRVEEMFGSDPVTFNDWAESLIGAFTPVTPAPISDNIAVNVAAGAAATALPQTIKPSVQNLANYNFYTGRPIVSGNMQEMPPAEQAYPHTSSAAKYMARNVLPKLGVVGSPAKTEAFVRDTFGGGAQVIIPAADALVEGMGLMPKQAEHGQANPIEAAKRGLTTAQGGNYDRQFYDLRKKLQDTIAQKQIDAVKSHPRFSALSSDEQQTAINRALGRAKAQVQQVTGRLGKSDGPEKVQIMKNLLAKYKQ